MDTPQVLGVGMGSRMFVCVFRSGCKHVDAGISMHVRSCVSSGHSVSSEVCRMTRGVSQVMGRSSKERLERERKIPSQSLKACALVNGIAGERPER